MNSVSDIQLTAFQSEDEALFAKWLGSDHIYTWFCCDGDDSEQARIAGAEEKQAWLDEIATRDSHPHRHLFIVTYGSVKIGFGMCLDVHGEPEYLAEQYSDLYGQIMPSDAYELGYCIGEKAYLNKGFGKIIIQRLEEQCRKLGAKLLLADPSDANIPSVKVLTANGFERYKSGDYRKQLAAAGLCPVTIPDTYMHHYAPCPKTPYAGAYFCAACFAA